MSDEQKATIELLHRTVADLRETVVELRAKLIIRGDLLDEMQLRINKLEEQDD